MAYTEIKQKNKRKYYYRVRTLRKGKKFKKQRIYLGKGLSKKELAIEEKIADNKLYKISDNKDKIKKEKLKIANEFIPKIKKILKKRNIKKAGIFGSYARGEQKKNSDIDILIKPPKGIGFGFAGIQLELQDKLKKKIDLVSYNGLSPHLKDSILKEEVRII